MKEKIFLAAIVLASVLIAASSYVTQDKTDDLDKMKITDPLDAEEAAPASDSNDDNDSPHDTFTSYEDEEIGISFDYPRSWKIKTPREIMEDSFYLTLDSDAEIKPGTYYGLGIAGYKDGYASDGMNDPCATSIEEFCENGCDRIGSNTALDYRITIRGEKGLHAYAFTDLSPHYPAICFDFSLEQIVRDIADRDGIGYYDALDKLQQQDLDLMIEAGSISPLASRQIDDFQSIIQSIRATR